MCTVFWDRNGVLLVDFLPRGSTINADVYYCETLKKLRAIKNKRRSMFFRVVLIHDNVNPHSAGTQHLLSTFKWEQFDHPSYNPDCT